MFLIYFLALSIGMFHFRNCQIQFHEPPPLSIKLWSVKFTFICQNIKRDTLEVLEDETELYSTIKFCETYWLSTILFKNISVVLPYFELCAF